MRSVLEVAGSQEGEIPAIGTLNEGALHAQLKNWYQRPGDRIERVVDGFVIELVRDKSQHPAFFASAVINGATAKGRG